MMCIFTERTFNFVHLWHVLPSYFLQRNTFVGDCIQFIPKIENNCSVAVICLCAAYVLMKIDLYLFHFKLEFFFIIIIIFLSS